MSKHAVLSQKLQAGEQVTYREYGNSMLPKLKSGVLVTVSPCLLEEVQVGDVVFSKVRGTYYLHYVKAVRDGQVQISNARGHINGWTRQVFGKLTHFENP